jgi:Fanconi anemia group M protein
MKKEIENIFSREKEKPKEKIKTTIVLDSREKQSFLAANLREQGAIIKFETLEIADYLINDIAIERKTFKDFQSSIIDKRLISQLENLKKYEKKLLILEGFYYNYSDSKINENALRGMMLTISLSFQVPIIFTENEEDTARFLILIAKKQDKISAGKVQEFSLRPARNIETLEQQKQFILEGFPGIGPTSAKKLMSSYKNLITIFKAKKKELLEKRILDEKTIERMKRVLEE